MFYKLTNTFVFINFEKKDIAKANKNDHAGLQGIHIFVFDSGQVDTNALKVFAENARNRRIRLIVHFADAKERAKLRKALKGVKKDEFFHFSLMHGDITFKPTRYQTITIHQNCSVSENVCNEKEKPIRSGTIWFHKP